VKDFILRKFMELVMIDFKKLLLLVGLVLTFGAVLAILYSLQSPAASEDSQLHKQLLGTLFFAMVSMFIIAGVLANAVRRGLEERSCSRSAQGQQPAPVPRVDPRIKLRFVLNEEGSARFRQLQEVYGGQEHTITSALNLLDAATEATPQGHRVVVLHSDGTTGAVLL
jgi:hypothetical protein